MLLLFIISANADVRGGLIDHDVDLNENLQLQKCL